MRRLQGPAGTGNFAGSDRLEHADPVLIRAQPPEAAERRTIRGIVISIRVRLPDFDHGIVHWHAIAVQNMARKPDSLPFCAWTGKTPKAGIGREREMEKRADSLRGSWRQVHSHFSNGVASRPRNTMLNR